MPLCGKMLKNLGKTVKKSLTHKGTFSIIFQCGYVREQGFIAPKTCLSIDTKVFLHHIRCIPHSPEE